MWQRTVEFLVCDYGKFDVAPIRYTPLPGGDSAIRQPWRSALAHLRESFGNETLSLASRLLLGVPPKQIASVNAMIGRRVRTTQTSSCGRLFDAVASIAGVHEATYEGQAAIELEMIAAETRKFAHLSLQEGIQSKSTRAR